MRKPKISKAHLQSLAHMKPLAAAQPQTTDTQLGQPKKGIKQ